MDATEEQKAHVMALLEEGEKLEAVRFLQETLNLEVGLALAMAEKLDEQRMIEAGEKVKITVAKSLQSSSRVPVLVGSIFAGIGLFLLTIAGYFIVRDYQFQKRAIVTQGTVLEFKTHLSKDSDSDEVTTMYTPVIQYNFQGKEYVHTSSTSSSAPDYEVGEEIEILVDPREPGDPLINTFVGRWLVVLILGFMGLLFIGIGVPLRKAFQTN